MYTRSYFDSGERGVPKDYDGTAFRTEDEKILITPTYGESKISPEFSGETEEASSTPFKEEKEGLFSKLFSGDTFKKLPFNIGGNISKLKDGLSLEDIIIVATALLLIFSKEGDILLGAALLCLLFIR